MPYHPTDSEAIRQKIKRELKRRGWSHYRLLQEMLKADYPLKRQSLYNYLSEVNPRDCYQSMASKIMVFLGLLQKPQ